MSKTYALIFYPMADEAEREPSLLSYLEEAPALCDTRPRYA